MNTLLEVVNNDVKWYSLFLPVNDIFAILLSERGAQLHTQVGARGIGG